MTIGGSTVQSIMLRMTSCALALALALSAIGWATPGLLAAPSRAAGDADVLVSQSATLTTHGPGLPASGTPAGRQLLRVEVNIEVDGIAAGDPSYFPNIDVHLAAAPDTWHDNDAQVAVAFGHVNGGVCQPSHVRRINTRGSAGSSYEIGGYTPDYWGGTPDRPWECVAVIVGSLDGTVTYDAMGGLLINTYQAPQIEFAEATLLGKVQKQFKLVRGVWTTYEVELKNSGPVETGGFSLTGQGKGLKVRQAVVERIGANSASTVRLKVKLVARKSGRLTLRGSGSGIDVKRSWKVSGIRVPAGPQNGKYRSKTGDVTFSIRNGRVIGWRGQMQTMCGGFGTIPTYTQNTYDFPSTRVARNGIIDAAKVGTAGGSAWSSVLRMQVKGARVTQGYFRFATVGPCSAVTTFTARRAGR